MNSLLLSALVIMTAALAGAAAFFAGYHMRKRVAQRELGAAELEAKRCLEEAQREACRSREHAALEAKELLLRTRQEFEHHTRDTRQELAGLEKRFLQREENLDRKVAFLEKKERDVGERE